MIYFNNAATSYPKPREVIDATAAALAALPHDSYRENTGAHDVALRCRQGLARIFGAPDPRRVVLTSGATESLNLAIHGLVREGGHVVTTQTEHTSMLRPLWLLEDKQAITLSVVPCDGRGAVDPRAIESAMTADTCLVCINHASNVTGWRQDIQAILHIAGSRGVPVLIDASQSAGVAAFDDAAAPHAAIAFTGHKALHGPAGTGGLVLGQELELKPWKVGGSGIQSERRAMPDIMPLKYEPGTQNMPGITGLEAAVAVLLKEGVGQANEKREKLAARLLDGLRSLGASVFAADAESNPCGIVSFTLDGWKPGDIGYVLGQSFDIRVRTGLHCAPLIHEALGTRPDGTVRVSVSRYNTDEEVATLLSALEHLRRTK